jgi:hypothetical protein
MYLQFIIDSEFIHYFFNSSNRRLSEQSSSEAISRWVAEETPRHIVFLKLTPCSVEPPLDPTMSQLHPPGITGFLGFFRSLVFWENSTFRKHDLSPSSGERSVDPYSIKSVRLALPNGRNWVDVSVPFHLRAETDPVPETLCSFRMSDDGRIPETQHSRVLCTIVRTVGFEILAAVVIKSSIFWDITPCSLLKANRSFRGLCRHHIQSLRIGQARNQSEAGSKQSLRLTFRSPKRKCNEFSIQRFLMFQDAHFMHYLQCLRPVK